MEQESKHGDSHGNRKYFTQIFFLFNVINLSTTINHSSFPSFISTSSAVSGANPSFSMPTNFLSLPGEIRNRIYGYILLTPGPVYINLKEFRCVQLRLRLVYDWWLWPLNTTKPDLNLFYVNRAIHKEAKSFFFSKNVFNFAASNTWTVVARIFEVLGRESVSQLEHVLIPFPGIGGHPLPYGEVDQTLEIFKMVRNYCTNLKTITTAPYSDRFLDPRLTAGNTENAIRYTLTEVDSLFQSIPSLREIIVKVDTRRPSPTRDVHEYISDFVKTEMERLGWRLQGIRE